MPKRGSLKSAGKRQESATFLQRSFSNVALQFFACCSTAFGQNDFLIAEKRVLQCNFCSAAFRKLQRNFHFRLRHVAGVGFSGWGLGLTDLSSRTPFSRMVPENAGIGESFCLLLSVSRSLSLSLSSRAAKGGGFKWGGGSRSRLVLLFCPLLSKVRFGNHCVYMVLWKKKAPRAMRAMRGKALEFLSFCVLFGTFPIFPICPGMVRGFS